MKKYRVVEPDGTVCPRCGMEAETRMHDSITEKHLSQPFYFRYWYHCNNAQCATKLFMLEEWKVMQGETVPHDPPRADLFEKDQGNLFVFG